MRVDSRSDREMRAVLRSRRTDRPANRLLEQLLGLGNGHAALISHAEQAWASATFAGSRHRIELAFEGETAVDWGERLIAALPDHEFDIRGHIVADAAIFEVLHQTIPAPHLSVTAELLLLEDG